MDQELLRRFRTASATVLQVLDDRIVRDNIAAIPVLLEKQNATLSRIENLLGDLLDVMRD